MSAITVRRFGAFWLTWSLTLCGASPPKTVTASSAASNPRLAWSGPQGFASLALGDRVRVLGRAALRRHVALPRARAAEVPETQAHRAAERRVGAVARAEDPGTGVHAETGGGRPVHDQEGRHGMGGRLDAVEVERRIEHRLERRDQDRHRLRPAAGHDGVDRDLLDRRLCPERRDLSDDVVRVRVDPREHRLDARLGRRHDRQPVRPARARKWASTASSESGSSRTSEERTGAARGTITPRAASRRGAPGAGVAACAARISIRSAGSPPSGWSTTRSGRLSIPSVCAS